MEKQRNSISNIVEYSFVLGLDYYHFTKDFWFHTWGNIMPYHLDTDNTYSYHNFNNNEQWYDYSGGMIFGWKINKSLGLFVENKYSKYWNRTWYDFKVGINYIIF